MRTASDTGVRAVSRWSLWVVALFCFGPLAFVWLWGVFALPLWFEMITARLTEPERFSHELAGSAWEPVWSILYVVSGFVGLVGLLRVLTLPQERPESNRVFTVAMVAVGLVALLVFDIELLNGIVSDLSEGIPVVGVAIYIALPFTGAAWLLFRSWKLLFAAHRA
jgi:hypothetical protein